MTQRLLGPEVTWHLFLMIAVLMHSDGFSGHNATESGRNIDNFCFSRSLDKTYHVSS